VSTLRVLLYAPLPGRDPPSGDTTYTETLLANPPPGVAYTTYGQALDDGRLVRRGRRPDRGRTSPADAAILGVRAVEKLARRRWMFPEQTWFISADPEAFDLIHNHIFSLRQVGRRLPMVSSAGFPLSELYRERNGWSVGRSSRADYFERIYARAVGSHRAGYWAPEQDMLTVYTERYRRWLLERGSPGERVMIVGQALGDGAFLPAPHDDLVGFIGRDFLRKGGLEAVDAFRRLRARLPEVTLLLLTDDSAVPPELRGEPRVEVRSGVTRGEVLDVHLPRLSLLLAPTRSDCGTPFGVIESMRAGVPVILSPGEWLDERLAEPGVYRASDPETVAHIAETLLRDPAQQQRARTSAREQFDAFLSLDSWHRELRAAYDRTLALARRT
jgi:glycosyltransferase involved in cell wall biosynthesis